jgi:hypothetical protein
MNSSHSSKLIFVIAAVFLGCMSKDCKEINEKDVIGYYVSMNSLNKGLQYLEVIKGGICYNWYCENGELKKEISKWEYIKNCTVYMENVYWLNSSKENHRGAANFGFNYGRILSMGDDVWSFKRVRFRPKLECE